jgi:hypothetical protein
MDEFMKSLFKFKSLFGLFLFGVLSFLSFAVLDPLTSQAASLKAEAAAKKAALQTPECKKIAPFYWEIGDAGHVLAGDSVGGKYHRDSKLRIASASKWIFAAYYLEKKNGVLNQHEKDLLRMLGGYQRLAIFPCAFRDTVAACFHARSNDKIYPATRGKFYYSGGDAQSLAVDLGLGALNAQKLGEEVSKGLKNKVQVEYVNLSLAGGARMQASQYVVFLQELMKGTYLLKKFLGQEAVCADPDSCPQTAAYSPAKGHPWKYGYHHWVETDDKGRVDAYSSAGLLGFYPWLTADLKYYGIIAREHRDERAGLDSVMCGRQIRKAYFGK